jgi:hypothetical protein
MTIKHATAARVAPAGANSVTKHGTYQNVPAPENGENP